MLALLGFACSLFFCCALLGSLIVRKICGHLQLAECLRLAQIKRCLCAKISDAQSLQLLCKVHLHSDVSALFCGCHLSAQRLNLLADALTFFFSQRLCFIKGFLNPRKLFANTELCVQICCGLRLLTQIV